MTDYYLDASALVKRYADESGSSWVQQITASQPQNTILLAEITLVHLGVNKATVLAHPSTSSPFDKLTLRQAQGAKSRRLSVRLSSRRSPVEGGS